MTTELTRKILLLNRTQIARIVKTLQEFLDKPEPLNKDRFQTLYSIATEMFGKGILTGSQIYNLVLGRRFIVYQMRDEGYSFADIASCLVRTTQSVVYMYKVMVEALDNPRIFKLEMAYWDEFQKKLKEKDNDKTGEI